MLNKFQQQLKIVVSKLSSEFQAQGQKDIDYIIQTGVNSYDDLLFIAKDDNEPNLQIITVWLLGGLNDKKAIPTLIEMLQYQNSKIRSAAALALGKLNSKEAINALIIAVIEEKDIEASMSMIYALGLIGDKQAFETLVNILNNQNQYSQLRGMAAEALANLGDKKAVTPLITALKDESLEVRFWAAFALGELGDSKALPELARLAIEDNTILTGWWSVKEEATAAIQRIIKM